MFKYLWEATFKDGHIIRQPIDDRYSKHVEGAEHNFTAFKDVLEYQETSPLEFFALVGHDRQVYAVSLDTGEFFVNGTTFRLEEPLDELDNRQIIFHRTRRLNMANNEAYIYAYNIGFKGNRPGSDKIVKKVVTIS